MSSLYLRVFKLLQLSPGPQSLGARYHSALVAGSNAPSTKVRGCARACLVATYGDTRLASGLAKAGRVTRRPGRHKRLRGRVLRKVSRVSLRPFRARDGRMAPDVHPVRLDGRKDPKQKEERRQEDG